jgi:hypothetical protein
VPPEQILPLRHAFPSCSGLPFSDPKEPITAFS